MRTVRLKVPVEGGYAREHCSGLTANRAPSIGVVGHRRVGVALESVEMEDPFNRRSHGECTPSGGGAGAGAGRERVGYRLSPRFSRSYDVVGEHFVLAGDKPVAGLRFCHLTR